MCFCWRLVVARLAILVHEFLKRYIELHLCVFGMVWSHFNIGRGCIFGHSGLVQGFITIASPSLSVLIISFALHVIINNTCDYMYILHVHVHLNVPKSVYIYGWWFGTFLFFHILGIIPTDEVIFFRGVGIPVYHQPDITKISGNVRMSPAMLLGRRRSRCRARPRTWEYPSKWGDFSAELMAPEGKRVIIMLRVDSEHFSPCVCWKKNMSNRDF